MSDLNQEALTAAHKAVEDALIEFRDMRVSEPFAANGFVVREADGEESSIIRFGTRTGLNIGIKAYLTALDGGDDE